MGQNERLNININYNHNAKTTGKTIDVSMESNGTLFGLSDSMGIHSFNISAGHQQPSSNLLSFFSRLGKYNVHNLLPPTKKMATLIIKMSVYLANMFGVSLFVYWLTIDFAGIKIFLTSVGVFLYGGMKLYEKYLDLKAKKRKEDDYEDSHKHINHKQK